MKLIENGDEFDSMMVVGHVGSLAEGEDKLLDNDTVRPVAGWFMFIKAGKVPGEVKHRTQPAQQENWSCNDAKRGSFQKVWTALLAYLHLMASLP